jgi:hypothetical protein
LESFKRRFTTKALQKINGGELMDAATSKQKAYIKALFVQGGLPDRIFSPLYRWRIDNKDADWLIHNLRMMIRYDHEELKDEICQKLLGKNLFLTPTKTIDMLEEEQAIYNPTCEDWLDQQNYDGVTQKEWVHELHQDLFIEGGGQIA